MNIEPLADDVPLNGPRSPKIDQIDDLIQVLVTIRHRFGNTAVSVESLKWGSSALWAESAAKKTNHAALVLLNACKSAEHRYRSMWFSTKDEKPVSNARGEWEVLKAAIAEATAAGVSS